MAEEGTATQVVTEPASGGMMKKLVLGGGALLLLGAGIFAGPAVMNMISPADEAETADGDAAAVDTDGPAIYQSLHPPLVVNFKDELGEGHFMQITLEVMSRDQDVINSVREHTPVIRNELILLFGNANYERVTTREGKEELLQDTLTVIQDVMSERIGEPGVEAVYFTSLVIQ